VRIVLHTEEIAIDASILDFIFVAGPTQQWQAKSWVVVRSRDFPDLGETSDHRPVAGVVELAVGQ
jgi:hypothetical protein